MKELLAKCREGRISILAFEYSVYQILLIGVLCISVIISYAVNTDKILLDNNLETYFVNLLPILYLALFFIAIKRKRFYLYISAICMALNLIEFRIIDEGGPIFAYFLLGIILNIIYARILKTDTHPF